MPTTIIPVVLYQPTAVVTTVHTAGTPKVVALKPSISLTTYVMRGVDSLGGFVYWFSESTPNLTPTDTFPPLIGTLSKQCVFSSKLTTSNL